MRKSRAMSWGFAALGFTVAFAAGLALAGRLAPERLRAEAEARLTEALGGAVAIDELNLTVGLGLRVRARGITAWPAEAGARLSVDRLEAGLRPFAHLLGGPLFSRLRLDGVRLSIARDRRGAWSPPPLAGLAEGWAQSAPRSAGEPWLAPLASLEALTRALLGAPGFADGIELHDAAVAFADARPPTPGAAPVALALEGVEARLRRFRILGGAELFVRGRLSERGAERGSLEVLGSRNRDGSLRLALATTSLDLGSLAPYLALHEPPAQLAGRLSGYLGYETPAAGEGVLELDLVLTGLRSLLPAVAPERPLEIERLDLAGFLEVSPERLWLRDTRLESAALSVELAGSLARPIRDGSLAELSFGVRELDRQQLRDLVSWLPRPRREETEAFLERIEAARLAQLHVNGAAALERWQAFITGRGRELPSDFSLEADVAEMRLRVGDHDHLEDLSGHVAWTGDRLEVRGARATLRESELPVLDLELDGISNFLAGDPQRRRLRDGGKPLRGIGALADVLAGKPDAEPKPPIETRIRLAIDALDHPLFLWPIEALGVEISLEPDGVRLEKLAGRWAGVPIAGEADLVLRPERKARVRLVASAPEASPAAVERGAGWGHGSFEVERLTSRLWSHEHARGRFTARDARVEFEDIEAELAPSGRVLGNAFLDFARKGSVPYRVSFSIEQGDVSGIAAQLQLPADVATGRIDLAGSFEGKLEPGAPASDGLTGLLSARAREGEIRRVLPAVVAIALASRSFNPFTGRELIRYDRADTVLEFADGGMHTEAFSIDGPDLRVFASGDLSLSTPQHEVDAHVVLFLFRQFDNVIEKIPVLNLLLLGTNENMLAAYYDLTGPWASPEASLVPLRSLAAGPASLVLEGVPFLVRKGLEAIGALDAADTAPARPFSPEPPPPRES